MMTRFFAAGLALVVMAATAQAQTVVLVRHAEKADQSADPVLSAAGEARAEALAASLADAQLTRVLATPLLRTRLTAAPSAEAAGLEVTQISLEGGGAAHVSRVVEAVRGAAPSDTVLVVGHSNTVPEIARALGAASAAPMTDCEYDRMIVIRLDGDTSVDITGRYGAPANC